MKEYITQIYPFIVPAIILVFSVVTGIIFERIVLVRLMRIAEKTTWEVDDVIVDSFRGKAKFFFIIGGFYAAVQNSPLNPGSIKFLSKGLIVLMIFFTTLIASRVSTELIRIYHKKRHSVVPVISIFSNLTKMLVIVIGLLLILQFLGISITPILTALGVGGLAVALALQDTLSNLFAGIHLIVTRQINVGDYIMLETGIEGHVVDISWRYTNVKTITDNLIVIPNSKLASSLISNYSLPVCEMSLKVQVGVSYDSDLEMVEDVTLDVAREVMREVPGCVTDYDPFMRYHTFDDSSINFNVILRISDFVEKFKIQHEFVKRLHSRYNREGIIIPFPIRTVHFFDKSKKNS